MYFTFSGQLKKEEIQQNII